MSKKLQSLNQDPWYVRGQIFYELNRFEEAVSAIDRSIELDRFCPTTWTLRGLVRFKQGYFIDALLSFTYAAELPGASEEAWQGRGWSCCQLQKWEDAAICFEQAIILNRHVAAYHADLGAVVYKLGQFERGVACIEQAVNLDPSANNWQLLAEGCAQIGDKDRAIFCQAKALNLHSHFALKEQNQILDRQLEEIVVSGWRDQMNMAIRSKNQTLAIHLSHQIIQSKYVNADDWVDRGGLMVESLNFTESIDYFDRALKLHPTHFNALVKKGQALIEIARGSQDRSQLLEQSLACFDLAHKINPQAVNPCYYRGCIFSELNLYQDALASFQCVVELNPGNVAAWYKRGLLLSHQGQLFEAIDSFDRAIELNPGNATLWYKRGRVYQRLDCYPQAIDNFDRCLALNPRHLEAQTRKSNLAEIIARQNRLINDAFERLEQKFDPREVANWIERGTTFRKLGDLTAALECFDRAISLDPNCPKLWQQKGSLLADRDDLTAALECFDRAISLDPNCPDYYALKGQIHIGSKDYASAIESCNLGLAICQSKVALKSLLRRALIESGDLELAKKTYDPNYTVPTRTFLAPPTQSIPPPDPLTTDWLTSIQENEEILDNFDRAIRDSPFNPDLRMERGLHLVKKGHVDEAVDSLNQALQIDPEHAQTLSHIGKIYKNLNQLDRALAYFGRALQIDRSDFIALSESGYIYKDREEFKNALKYFDAALHINPDSAGLLLAKRKVLCRLDRFAEAKRIYISA